MSSGAHPAQYAILRDTARFRIAACGRRFGKSKLGVAECLKSAVEQNQRVWWIAPTYKMSNVGWRQLAHMSGMILGCSISKSDRSILFSGGGSIAIRSADNPSALRSEGLDLVIIDEAAFVNRDVWIEAIRPALSDRLGRALFISTPKGRNWFWELYQRGIRGEDGYKSFTFPTSSNPFIPADEIEAARRELPEIIFRQEYLAEFIDDNGGVFRRVQDAVHHIDHQPDKARQYVAGVDVAQSVDYTVVTVFDQESRTEVAKDRFNRVDYPTLEDRLLSIYRFWNISLMIIESNSIGQPVIDHLRDRGMAIQAFTTTSATKQQAIQNLQSAFEHGDIHIMDDPVTIGELLSFEGKRSQSGAWIYSAPIGLHDDCVMSMAIAYSAFDTASWLVS